MIRAPALAAGLAVALAAGLGACGSGSPRTIAQTSTSQEAFKTSTCMRAHHVPNFPDPTGGSGGEGFSVAAQPGSSTLTVDGIAFSGPAFEAAEKACQFGGAGGRPRITEAMKEGMIAKAHCIRSHGVPGFPDPRFGLGVGLPLPPGMNPDSPAIQRAAKACAGIGIGIPGSDT
jgi:hypothetical protein